MDSGDPSYEPIFHENSTYLLVTSPLRVSIGPVSSDDAWGSGPAFLKNYIDPFITSPARGPAAPQDAW